MEPEERTPRPEKVAVVDEVSGRLGSSAATILTEYRGLSVGDLQVLRRALAAAGGEYRVYKNTLVRRAAQTSGHGELQALLTGPTALAFVQGDVSAVAKALKEFARTNPHLVVKGALVGGGLFDAAQTSAIADLPSRDVLLAGLAGGLAAPLQRFAGLLAALPQRFAYALAALIESRGGSADEADAARAPADEEEEVGPAPAAAEGAAPGEEDTAMAPVEEQAPPEAPEEAPALATGGSEETSGAATTGGEPAGETPAGTGP